MSDLISVIVTTYNRDDALDAVLRSLAAQRDRDFEVVIADDGSGPKTARVVEAWSRRMPVPVRHVWQEDRGFRAAESRNRAILASRGSYILFLDGDCLAPTGFVAAHRRLAAPGWFVAGNRVLLSRSLTARVLRDRSAPEIWNMAEWSMLRLTGDANRLLPLARLPLGGLRRWRPQEWRGVRSCNLAAWRADLDRVDGFDAAYSGWGLEDSDLAVRLIRAGVRRKDGRFATGVLHLWHREYDHSRLAENQSRLDEAVKASRIRAQLGMSTTV